MWYLAIKMQGLCPRGIGIKVMKYRNEGSVEMAWENINFMAKEMKVEYLDTILGSRGMFLKGLGIEEKGWALLKIPNTHLGIQINIVLEFITYTEWTIYTRVQPGLQYHFLF